MVNEAFFGLVLAHSMKTLWIDNKAQIVPQKIDSHSMTQLVLIDFPVFHDELDPFKNGDIS